MPTVNGVQVIGADLGPVVAVFACEAMGCPIAVVNTFVKHDPALRNQAKATLLHVGVDAGLIDGVLDGICS